MWSDPAIFVVEEIWWDGEEKLDIFIVVCRVIELKVNPDPLVHDEDVVAPRRYGVFAQLLTHCHPIGRQIVPFTAVYLVD